MQRSKLGQGFFILLLAALMVGAFPLVTDRIPALEKQVTSYSLISQLQREAAAPMSDSLFATLTDPIPDPIEPEPEPQTPGLDPLA